MARIALAKTGIQCNEKRKGENGIQRATQLIPLCVCERSTDVREEESEVAHSRVVTLDFHSQRK